MIFGPCCLLAAFYAMSLDNIEDERLYYVYFGAAGLVNIFTIAAFREFITELLSRKPRIIIDQ